MDELHALLSLCTDAVLGNKSDFKETYENAIARGEQRGADRNARGLASERRKQLQRITSKYILRRTKEEELSEELTHGKEEKDSHVQAVTFTGDSVRNVVGVAGRRVLEAREGALRLRGGKAKSGASAAIGRICYQEN